MVRPYLILLPITYLSGRPIILGVFKFKTEEDGSVSSDAPQFQMFQCRHAPTASDDAAETGGRTLFANTGMIYQQVLENGVSPYAAEVKAGKWTCFTPSNASFGGKPLEMPLIAKNPVSGRSVIRWHEHWCVKELHLMRKFWLTDILGPKTSLLTSLSKPMWLQRILTSQRRLGITLLNLHTIAASYTSTDGKPETISSRTITRYVYQV